MSKSPQSSPQSNTSPQTPLQRLLRYSLAVVAVVTAMGARLALTAWVGPGLPTYITYYPAIMVVALLTGLGPGLLATALMALSAAYWILPPNGISITSPVDRLGLVLFISMGLGMSVLAEFYQRQKRKAATYQCEVALRDTKARLATFAEATFEGIVESKAGRIVDCNEQFAKMSGYSVAELRAMDIADLINPEDRNRVITNIRQHQESITEHAMLRKDGTRIVVEVHSRLASPETRTRFSAIRDITDRQQAEQAVRQTKEEWERTFNSVPDLIAIINDQHRIVRVNQAMAERLNCTPEDCIGQTCYACVHGLTEPPPFCPHSQTLKDGRTHTDEVHEDRLGGDFLVTTSPLHDTTGRLIGTVHVARDITENKRREAQFQRLNRTLTALTRSSEAMLRATEEAAYLQTVCEIIEENCGHAMVWIGYAENDVGKTVRPVANSGFDAGYLETLKITWADTERGRGPTGTAIRSGRTSTCRSMLADPHFAPWREEALKRGFASSIALPLKTEERCFGAITIYSSQTNSFTEEEVMLLTELADNLAYGIMALRLRIERARVEESLRKSQSLLDATQRLAKIGGWDYDVVNGQITWTDSLYRLYGATPNTFDPNDFPKAREVFLPGDRERIKQAFKDLVKKGIAYDLELDFTSADGRRLWVRFMGQPELRDGRVVRVFGNIMDITELHEARAAIEEANRDLEARVAERTVELKNANAEMLREMESRLRLEKSLRESETRWRTLVDTTTDFIYSLDREGRYLAVNRAICEAFDLTEGQIVGKTYKEMGIPENLALEWKEFDQRVLNGESVRTETVIPLPRCGPRIYDLVLYPIVGQNGMVTGLTGISRDITEQRKIKEQLIQAQKMEAMGQLAGGVAHDFNNMLSVIMGNAEIALLRIDADHPLYSKLTDIKEASQRSADLTRQLLAFARKQTVTPKVLDLNTTVSGMLKMLQRMIGEDIEIVWKPGANLWPIKIDPSQIDQILANLSVNARDAISEIGSLIIETENITLDEAFCTVHPDATPGPFVMVAVSDNGCGMDEETVNHIFEPFFTTKGPGKGTGLGMATVYGIVQQNHGFINVVSEPGKGTTVKIYLHRFAGPDEEKTDTQAESLPKGHGETILVVEDEPLVLGLVRTMLETLGYRALVASTPTQAFALVAKYRQEIQLLLTDVVMPEMNGRELSKQILALNPKMRCLFMSGYSVDIISHRSELNENVQLITKPLKIRELAFALQAALELEQG